MNIKEQRDEKETPVSVPIFNFPPAGEFMGRTEQLATLEDWWAAPSGKPINMYGRRRVGKSWLFRKLAHGKKAIILVAARVTLSEQLSKFAKTLSPFLGDVLPDIKDLDTLFKVLYKIAEEEKILVVIDEFPYLLGSTKNEIFNSLSSIQAAMEEHRDNSKIKLILCGSAQAQMESMQNATSPLSGRLLPFELAPMTFHEARGFFDGSDFTDHLTRCSIAGGMPLYLASIGKGDLANVIATQIVNKNSALYSEVETSLSSELRDPAVYFSILKQLAVRPMESGEISSAIGKPGVSLSAYFEKLKTLRVIGSKSPLGADENERSNKWACLDGYARFYFRFVFPYKENLDIGGASATQHVAKHIMPFLAEHTSLEFEHIFRRWVNQKFSDASLVGNWWGNSLPGRPHSTEEIDLLGIKGKKVILAGEAKWQVDKLKLAVYTRLVNDKIPAVVATGMTLPKPPLIILASKGGFTADVINLSTTEPNIRLVDAVEILRDVV